MSRSSKKAVQSFREMSCAKSSPSIGAASNSESLNPGSNPGPAASPDPAICSINAELGWLADGQSSRFDRDLTVAQRRCTALE
jgi:hypothetical protein